RRRHTNFSRDWSSDVCSSDLSMKQTKNSFLIYFLAFSLFLTTTHSGFSQQPILTGAEQAELYLPLLEGKKIGFVGNQTSIMPQRSEERRVGKGEYQD